MRAPGLLVTFFAGCLSVGCAAEPDECAGDRRVLVGIETPDFVELDDGDELRVFVPPQGGAASVLALRITCATDDDPRSDLSIDVRSVGGASLAAVSYGDFPAFEYRDDLQVPHVMVYYGDTARPEDVEGDVEIRASADVAGEVVPSDTLRLRLSTS
jgi:hypothetical protein